jgi:hypothetical protein
MRTLKMIFLGIGAAIGLGLNVSPVNASLLFPSLQAPPSAATTARSGPRSGPRYYGYGRYNPGYNDPDAYRTPQYNNPDAYPIGSSRWWEEMDRQNRGGNGGGGR